MPSFGTTSKERLATCDPILQGLFNEVIKYYDCAIICGHRGEAEQNKAFEEGRSKLKWPNGKHNKFPSQAVDVMPYPIEWNNVKRLRHFIGFVQGIIAVKGLRVRSGHDWDNDYDLDEEKFKDGPHWEIY